jgi:hypothetical protein
MGPPIARALRGAFLYLLVSRRSEFDELIQSENGQLLWWDEQLDAARDAGLLVDQAKLVEGL